MKKHSVTVVNASILLYVAWLMLPAVQTTGRALTGAFSVMLFAVGVVMDWQAFRACWKDLCLRALCMAIVPLILRLWLRRGGDHFAGFYVQQCMFWFPLVFAGYARTKGDPRLWRFLKAVLLSAVIVTVCTTIGWLIQGMLRGGRVYAYSRSLGYGGEGREAYLKELMLRNIGGYDFVYAMVVALPFTCIAIGRSRGWRRWAFLTLLSAQTVMIVLSQYTYAMLFAAAVLAVELVALLLRKAGRLGRGKSLLYGLLPLVLVLVLLKPLVLLAENVCQSVGLSNFAFSFQQLGLALQGEAALSADSRLGYYQTALGGFVHSPFVGSLFKGQPRLSQHSEVLDLLSATGIVGTACVGFLIWLMGRGLLRGVKTHPERAQLCVAAMALLACATLGTVFYSRDIMAVAALGTLLVLEEGA